MRPALETSGRRQQGLAAKASESVWVQEYELLSVPVELSVEGLEQRVVGVS